MEKKKFEFKCKQCGHCCHLEGYKSKPERKEKSGLLLSLFSDENSRLPLFEWEVKRLNKLAKEKGIDLNIKPASVFYSTRTNETLIIMWDISEDICPFLNKENRCMIYEDRPIVCRMFPFKGGFSTGFADMGNCPNLPIGDFGIVNIKEILPEEAEAYQEFEIATLFVKSTIQWLLKTGLFIPQQAGTFKDILVAKAKNAPMKGVIEYAIEKGVLTEEELKETFSKAGIRL